MRALGLALVAVLAVANPALAKRPIPAASPEPAVTGLVLDARGLGLIPCMAPRVVDPSARNVLEGLTFDPDKVVADGFAGWMRAYNVPEKNPRVGARPVVVKATRLESGDKLFISAEDAARLRTPELREQVLTPMHIIIVY